MPITSLQIHNTGNRFSRRGASLTEVPADVVALAASLRALDLASNQLESLSLPPALPALEELLLADNLLDAPTVQRLQPPLPPTLKILDLTANRLIALPPMLLQLPQLAVLRLARQQLRSLPKELYRLGALEELDVSFNRLESALPLDEPGLPKLRTLLLQGNCLRTLALEADALPRLRTLDASGNKITEWPECLGKLGSLHTLLLGNNGLKSLVGSTLVAVKRMWTPGSGVHELLELSVLGAEHNDLRELPPTLRMLKQLSKLDVRCNPIATDALRLAQAHCDAIGARLRCVRFATMGAPLLPPSVAPGPLLVSDPPSEGSAACHRPTLLRAHVTHIVSIAPPARADRNVISTGAYTGFRVAASTVSRSRERAASA